MPLFIDNKRLIPAPFVSIDRSINFAGDGRPIGQNYRITLNGTLLPNKGSPLSTGWYSGDGYPPDQVFTTDEEKHEALLAKQDLLNEVFAGPSFEFKYLPSGGSPVICRPKLVGLTITPGTWVIKSDYQVSMEAAVLSRSGTKEFDLSPELGTSGYFLTSATDTWSIAERDDGQSIYQIQRTVGATADTQYTTTGAMYGGVNESWRNAKAWVVARMGTNAVPTGNYFGLSVTGTLYNLVEDENIDTTAGSYSINRRYTYGITNYIEERSISRVTEFNLLQDGGPIIDRISVNGTIQGLAADNTPSGKLVAAWGYWNSIAAGLGTLVGANGNPVSRNVTEDTKNGTLNYSLEFINNSGSIFKHVYDVSFTYDSASNPSVSINGTIEGVTSDGFPQGGNQRFVHARSGWDVLSPTLKSLAFAESTIFGGASYTNNFADFPVNKNVAFNKANGVVTYNYTYGYLNDGSDSDQWTHDFTVEFNTTNGNSTVNAGLITSASINGTIVGLTNSDIPTTRYNNAVSGWQSVRGNLFTYVNDQYARFAGNASTLPLSSGTQSRGMVFNKAAGTISYNTTFGNFKVPGGDVAVADVTIENTLQSDVFAIQQIPGRVIGPIVQNIGTKTEATRTINVNLTMLPKGGTAYWDFSDRGTVYGYASGYLATGVSDLGTYGTNWLIAGRSENWDWKNGLYNHVMSVVIVP